MSQTSRIESDRSVGEQDGAGDVLAGISLFQDLPAAVRQALSDSADQRTYSAGQTVFSVGQYDGAEFYVVLSGRLKITITDSENGAMIIEEFGANSIFGLELSLCEGNAGVAQQMSVTAEEDLQLIAVDAESFRALAGQRPSLMRKVALFLSAELATVRFKSTAVLSAPEQRVFAALLQFVERDAVSGAWRIQKMPKHRELADLAGVEEALAASAVAALIQEEVAQRDYPGMIINDLNRLNQLAS